MQILDGADEVVEHPARVAFRVLSRRRDRVKQVPTLQREAKSTRKSVHAVKAVCESWQMFTGSAQKRTRDVFFVSSRESENGQIFCSYLRWLSVKFETDPDELDDEVERVVRLELVDERDDVDVLDAPQNAHLVLDHLLAAAHATLADHFQRKLASLRPANTSAWR